MVQARLGERTFQAAQQWQSPALQARGNAAAQTLEGAGWLEHLKARHLVACHDVEQLQQVFPEKYRDMREYFRKTAISLDEDIRAGIDYERFRKEHFGGFRLTNDGTSLDSLWPEISGRWPEFFSPDTPIQDQPQVVRMRCGR